MQNVSEKPFKSDIQINEQDILFRLDMKTGEMSGDIIRVVAQTGFLFIRGKFEFNERFYPFEYQLWCSRPLYGKVADYTSVTLPGSTATTRIDKIDVSLNKNNEGTYVLIAMNDDFNLKLMMNPGNYCYCDFFRNIAIAGDYYVEEVIYSENPLPYTVPMFDPLDLLKEAE